MKNTTQVNVIQTNSLTGRKSVRLSTTLADAVEAVRCFREDGDGSWQFSIETLSGQPVTRGQVRAAGL